MTHINKNKYPKGTIIELIYMDDPQAPPTGTQGTIKYVDDAGQIHVNWDNGSGLALNTDYGDKFKIIK